VDGVGKSAAGAGDSGKQPPAQRVGADGGGAPPLATLTLN